MEDQKTRDMTQTNAYSEILRFVFPEGLLQYFDVVKVVNTPIPLEKQLGVEVADLDIYLEEKDEFRYAEAGHKYRPNGFYESSKVRDFPLRDRRTTLIIKRRRWVDETTGKSVGNKYELTAEGTRHSLEFAAFLKEAFGQIPDISIFS